MSVVLCFVRISLKQISVCSNHIIAMKGVIMMSPMSLANHKFFHQYIRFLKRTAAIDKVVTLIRSMGQY